MVSARVACTAARGQGGNCAFPSCSLTRRSSGVSHIFVATFIKATVLSAGFAGAKPPPSRKTFIKERCSLGTACPTVLSAGRFIVAFPKSHINCSSVSPGDPEPPGELPLARLTPCHQGRPAQVRRRFCTAYAVPVASNSAFEIVSSRALRPSYAADVSPRASAEHLTALPLVPLWTNVWCHQAGPT